MTIEFASLDLNHTLRIGLLLLLIEGPPSGESTLGSRWPDRRPIASLIIATAATHWSHNPRGWLLDPHINIDTPAGRAEFHGLMSSWAKHSVEILKKTNAQGMITWDLEGEQFEHPITYVGDPTLCANLAPEMDAIADEYFSYFRSAGLRVGVTIRPQHFTLTGGNARQLTTDDPLKEMSRKIAYARKRWGASIFYIDSNGYAGWPVNAGVMSKLAVAFPDVLLVPEHKNLAYYANTSPYSDCKHDSCSTPLIASLIYPEAFSVVNTADCDVNDHFSELIAAANRGDILMFRGWFDDPANAIVKAIVAQSRFKAQ